MATNMVTKPVMFAGINPIDIPGQHLVYSRYMTGSILVIPARKVVRQYKKVFAQVTQTNEPVIVAASNGPKVAIVSMETLEKLQQLSYQSSAKALLTLSQQARALLKDSDLPADLSEKHDEYLWQEHT
jgi:hypothetical protein